MVSNEILEFEFGPGIPAYSLDDLCEICQVTVDSVYELIDYGVLVPDGASRAEWRFSTQAIVQARRAHRLQRDLEINLAGIALALELIDDNARLRRELASAHALLAQLMASP